MAEAAIELIGINKSFGAVRANRDINLDIERGTIHGIVGENGAGKSTLMSILYGFYQADSGEIRVGGKPAAIKTPNDAIARRHRHGPPAFHAGRELHRARERHPRRRRRGAAENVASPRRAPSLSGWSANTGWRSIPTRSSRNCRSACSSASRS